MNFNQLNNLGLTKPCQHLSTTVVDRGEEYVFCNDCHKTWSEDAWTDFKEEKYLTNFYQGINVDHELAGGDL